MASTIGLSSERDGAHIYTVSKLTKEIKDLLEDHFNFVWVEGEISNFRKPSSGHAYMVLKDDRAQVRAVMFRTQVRYLKFIPEDGLKVIAQGKIGVYQPRGEYQLILDYLEPLGVGALALAFEQLKKKLASQGIFDESMKKPLPYLPQKVAVITSPSGAAIRDFLSVIQRRFANIEITLVPVRVQGEGASKEIVEAIDIVNKYLHVDVIVLTRGGGSLEDLWAFNEEALALAIRSSRIPVVSAVGHEIDITIADLASDMRAPTPSAAAELIVTEKDTLENHLKRLAGRLISGINHRTQTMYQTLRFQEKRLRDPGKRVGDFWIRLDELQTRLNRQMTIRFEGAKRTLYSEERTLLSLSPEKILSRMKDLLAYHRRSLAFMMQEGFKKSRMGLEMIKEKMKDLSPLSVLKRGYSISEKLPEKRILKSASELKQRDRINIVLAEGEVECRVDRVKPKCEIFSNILKEGKTI